MPDLIVLCPSHQRPKEASDLFQSFLDTRQADSLLRFAVWNEDPTASLYGSLPTTHTTDERMTPRTNRLALWAAEKAPYIGWVADDNRFRTKGWDRIVLDALQEAPIVFGNDVTSPGSKPSHVFMDSRIVRSLGWLIHPGLKSTFFDDVWSNLGVGPIDVSRPLFQWMPGGWLRVNGEIPASSGLGISYLADVVVEHLYTERDNSRDFMADMEIYQHWLRNDCEDDIQRARREMRKETHVREGRIQTRPTAPGTPPEETHAQATQGELAG